MLELKDASQGRTKFGVGDLRPQSINLSWSFSKVLPVFLYSFLIGFRGFSPILELFVNIRLELGA